MVDIKAYSDLRIAYNRVLGDVKYPVFSVIDLEDNSYDCNDLLDFDVAIDYLIFNKNVSVAVLDACSFEYLGYITDDDLNELDFL